MQVLGTMVINEHALTTMTILYDDGEVDEFVVWCNCTPMSDTIRVGPQDNALGVLFAGIQAHVEGRQHDAEQQPQEASSGLHG